MLAPVNSNPRMCPFSRQNRIVASGMEAEGDPILRQSRSGTPVRVLMHFVLARGLGVSVQIE